jgi:hypothetical protein
VTNKTYRKLSEDKKPPKPKEKIKSLEKRAFSIRNTPTGQKKKLIYQ